MTTETERDRQQGAQLDEEAIEEREEEERQEAGSLAIPIGLLILAMITGCFSLALVVFGAWPGIILVAASLALSAYAVRRIKRYDEAIRH
jgi:fatty acid desaturase